MMFAKNTNQQYLPHVPFSLQTRAFTSDLIANNEIQLQYPANSPVLEAATLFNYGVNQNANVGFNGDHCVMVGPRKQMASKKDRHRKIYTSQGPRDRRVRLSTGIARKFFDLQEMLGFDKPSKTLDWLLSKSMAAIKELVLSKSANNSFSQEGIVSVISHASKSSVEKKANLSKESRTKARVRARERTKEKMCIKQLNEARIHQLSKNPQVPHVFGFHQQNGIATSSNGVQNWDYSNFVSQTNQLCAILDQHKFIN